MPLFTTIAELKEYNASANLGIDVDTIKPSYNHVENSVIIPELGQAQYDALLASYIASLPNLGPPMSAPLAALLVAVRKVIAPLAMLHYKNAVIQQLSDAGALEKASENGSPARMWVNNLQSETLFTEGMKALDLLLAFLETNKADYPLWVSGSGYTEFKEFILQTTKEFNDEVNISDSRKFFKAIRPDIKYAERMILTKHIGDDFYNRIVTARKDGTIIADEIIALKKIFPVVANYAIANTSLSIEHGNDGTYTIFSQSEFSGNKNNKQPPSAAVVESLKQKHERRAQQYLDQLLTYLNDTATALIFPEYFNSNYYTAPSTDAPTDINDELEKTFAF